ncbi:hypothetical protein [Desulfitobacterium metallireducens]|uniref:Uncharacterized protein n=1 Tax=Desulfitobacterium metallireducens DSM 15288 TaxID=871968 RepID=W0EH74_9FIRM|nr:hypothetical protein [Desulfitobacterium metallireducens]AHF08564.1 hypothetical protein DESME_08890 [Desulfitobacterium metallireducens DSM 15288]
MANTRTLKELQDLTLKLINSYSSDGQPLTVGDNADLLQLINDYLNIAYYEFAQSDKILSSKDYVLTDGTVRPDGVTYQYTLPADFLDFYKLENSVNNQEVTDFSVMDNLLMVETTNPITLWYFVLPDRLTNLTDIPRIRPQYHDYLAYFPAGKWLHQNGRQADGIDLLTMYNDAKDAVIPFRRNGVRKIKNVMGW